MKIQTAPLGSMGANFYIVTDEQTQECFVVDPGADGDIAASLVKESKANLKYIILTHAHVDHIGALDYLKSEFGAPVVVSSKDKFALNDDFKTLCSNFGVSSPITEADIAVDDNSTLPFGNDEIKFIHTPGHTPDSMCIYYKSILISGDTLFEQSIGRTDFPGGSFDKIEESIKNKLYTLDNTVKVYPGHGNPTTIGNEKLCNPFVRG